MALDQHTTPSGNFNLSHWKIGLPIDSAGDFAGTSVEVKDLSGYEHSKYFYTAADGAMTFVAPVEGATTQGSRYARSELREMNGTERAAWSLARGGVLSATLEVDRAPIKFDGTAGRVVVGQIHGQDDELVRLYWDDGKLYFVNDRAGPTNSETRFHILDATGNQPHVSLNERFSYTIRAKGHDLIITVVADGRTYKSISTINDVWQSDSFYFKAGVYLGVNESQGTGYGQTSFYALSMSHDGTSTTSIEKTIASAIRGDVGKNTLRGKATADIFYSGYGNDMLYGGRGKDTFVFDTKLGTSKTDRAVNFDTIKDFSAADDAIWLDNEIFTKLGKGTTSKPIQLGKDFFVTGSEATDRNDYILYDKKTGVLSYDADASDSKAAVEFAKVKQGTLLTNLDLFVV